MGEWDGAGGTAECTHIRFRAAQLELYQPNPSLFHPRRPSSIVHDALVECDPLDHLGIFYCPTDLFDDPNIAEIDVGRGGSDETSDGGYGNRGKGGGVLRNDLRASVSEHSRDQVR